MNPMKYIVNALIGLLICSVGLWGAEHFFSFDLINMRILQLVLATLLVVCAVFIFFTKSLRHARSDSHKSVKHDLQNLHIKETVILLSAMFISVFLVIPPPNPFSLNQGLMLVVALLICGGLIEMLVQTKKGLRQTKTNIQT